MRSWLIPLWLAFLLLITIPYLFAAMYVGESYVFGGFLINLQDGNSYLAKMYQGWRGDWQFTLPFTAQPGEGAYLFLFYLFLGHLARWSGLPLLVVFHTARVLSAIALAVALYHFLHALQMEQVWLRRAYTLALLGSGMGWLVFWSGNLTSDFWVVETYPFLSAYSTPHFALGLAVLLWLLALPVNTAPGWLKEALAGLAALLLATFSPFGVVVCLAVLGGVAAWLVIQHWLRNQRWKALVGGAEGGLFFFVVRRIIWVSVGGLPLLFYYYWAARSLPALAQWDAQNLTPAPPLWDLLLSLSPALLAALPGAWAAARKQWQPVQLLLIWAVVEIALVYLPVGLQRRFMMGFYIPLAGLAGLGFAWLERRWGPMVKRLANLAIALSLPTNLLLLAVAMFGVVNHDPLLYLSRGEANALDWLEKNAPVQAVVLASPQTSLFIPGYTGRRVVYGHPFETVDAESERRAVEEFFQNRVSAEAFFQQRPVDYLFYGPREQAMAPQLNLDGLVLAYSAQGVEIYRRPGIAP